jgi:hypothetical protein
MAAATFPMTGLFWRSSRIMWSHTGEDLLWRMYGNVFLMKYSNSAAEVPSSVVKAP